MISPSQTRQALLNVIAVLEAAGATPADVVTMNVNLVAPADIAAAFPVVGEVWGPHPAAVTVLQVADLGPMAHWSRSVRSRSRPESAVQAVVMMRRRAPGSVHGRARHPPAPSSPS